MSKEIKKIIKEIKPNNWYKPMDISKRKWLIGFTGKNSYYAVLDLIKQNRLRAKDFGRGKTPYYRVSGVELLRYLEKFK